MVPESCSPYKASKGSQPGDCGTCDKKSLSKTYRLSDYYAVGGGYGEDSVTVRSIMEDLMENGPQTVAFEATYNFMLYKRGIYKSIDLFDWLKWEDSEKPEWYMVTHAVLLYGWGEDEDGK